MESHSSASVSKFQSVAIADTSRFQCFLVVQDFSLLHETRVPCGVTKGLGSFRGRLPNKFCFSPYKPLGFRTAGCQDFNFYLVRMFVMSPFKMYVMPMLKPQITQYVPLLKGNLLVIDPEDNVLAGFADSDTSRSNLPKQLLNGGILRD